jgi:tetratricopeptide (TPR) repeat protein
MIAAVAAAIALFFALWWMLIVGGDEAPWVPAGLAASVVLLVALSAREVVMRRAWTRYLLENSVAEGGARGRDKPNSSRKTYSTSLHAAALATIQKQSAEADTAASPDSHLDVFHLCQNYLESTEEALRANKLPPEKRNAIRAGQERVRSLEKHHLLTWARDSSRVLTHDAQKRVRVSDKIETANRAVECLDSALRVFPEEHELNESKLAIREFIASVKVAHWVELAERAAFKGHYRRAIDRYKDALFYLERESVKEDVRMAGADRIYREIEVLRGRLKSPHKAH